MAEVSCRALRLDRAGVDKCTRRVLVNDFNRMETRSNVHSLEIQIGVAITIRGVA